MIPQIFGRSLSVVALPALAQSTHSDPVFKNFNDLKWEKTNPELGDNSQEIAILHVNPTTKATELFIGLNLYGDFGVRCRAML